LTRIVCHSGSIDRDRQTVWRSRVLLYSPSPPYREGRGGGVEKKPQRYTLGYSLQYRRSVESEEQHMSSGTTRRPAGSTHLPPRSIRASDAVWEKAKRRAQTEELSVSGAVQIFLEAYGAGLINLPKRELRYARPE
jgi:hypothetical protein